MDNNAQACYMLMDMIQLNEAALETRNHSQSANLRQVATLNSDEMSYLCQILPPVAICRTAKVGEHI